MAERWVPGVTLCCRCGHPVEAGDRWDADHDDETNTYRGMAHRSPCTICKRRCNQSYGGKLGALMQGKVLAEKFCIICGKPFVSTMRNGSTGKPQATCGTQSCIDKIRAIRKSRLPDPEPPPASGREW